MSTIDVRTWSVEEQRAAVVSEALSWIGTGYAHMGRVKSIKDERGRMVDKGAVDCAQLLYCVYHAVGLIDLPPLEEYSPQWMLNGTLERFLEKLMGYAREVKEEEVLPGDVVLYKMARLFAHGGIVIEPGWPSIVHAYTNAQHVIISDGNLMLGAGLRPRRFFTRW